MMGAYDMYFGVHRDCDTLRLRKVVLCLSIHTEHGEEILVDRRRMFAGPFFAGRLARKKARMLKLAAKMLEGSGKI